MRHARYEYEPPFGASAAAVEHFYSRGEPAGIAGHEPIALKHSARCAASDQMGNEGQDAGVPPA